MNEIITCPNCGQKNRIDQTQDNSQAICAKCWTRLNAPKSTIQTPPPPPKEPYTPPQSKTSTSNNTNSDFWWVWFLIAGGCIWWLIAQIGSVHSKSYTPEASSSISSHPEAFSDSANSGKINYSTPVANQENQNSNKKLDIGDDNLAPLLVPVSSENSKFIVLVKMIRANIRMSPSSYGKILGTVKQGDQLSVIDTIGSYYLINTSSGKGFVHKSTVQDINHSNESNKNNHFKPYTPEASSPISSHPEARIPINGTEQAYTTDKRIAPLEIKTSPGTNYLVKLVSAYSKQPVMTIFIIGGSTISTKVPLGAYEIKYASGQKWHSYENLFGSHTKYNKANEIFTFQNTGYQVSGYTITLYQVSNGNLSTSTISPSQF